MADKASYDPAGPKCLGACQNGVAALRNVVLDHEIAAYDLGCYNCRTIHGSSTRSLHSEGRAQDFGIKNWALWAWRLGFGHPAGYRLSRRLVARASELGIQEVIWAGQIWSNARPTWRGYGGVDGHYNHVHVGLNWWGANNVTEMLARRILYPVLPPTVTTNQFEDDMHLNVNDGAPHANDRLPIIFIDPQNRRRLLAVFCEPFNTSDKQVSAFGGVQAFVCHAPVQSIAADGASITVRFELTDKQPTGRIVLAAGVTVS